MPSLKALLGLFLMGSSASAWAEPSVVRVLGQFHVDSVKMGAVTWHEPRDDQYLDSCHPVTDSAGYTPRVNDACDRDVTAIQRGKELILLRDDAAPGTQRSFLLKTNAILNKRCQETVSGLRRDFDSELCRAVAVDETPGRFYFSTSGDLKDPFGAAESAAIFTGGLLGFPIGQGSVFRVDAEADEIRIEQRTLSVLFVPVKTITRYHLSRR